LTPGPGQYNYSFIHKIRNPSYGLGSEKRAFAGNTSALSIPASNTYYPSTSLIHKSESKWGFGSEERKGVADEKYLSKKFISLKSI
jgi:hypothetical protein